MPSIITVAQLRSVLGVSSALYSDAYLADIVDTSEQVILPLLNTFSSPVSKVKLESNVATFTTTLVHEFTVGQSVVITGCGAPFNGTHIVLDTEITDFTFQAAITNADIDEKNIIPAGTATLFGASTYVGVSAVETAVTVVAVEVFQSITAPGGQIEGVDFAPTPFRMGRSLYNRVSGLLGAYVDVESIAQ